MDSIVWDDGLADYSLTETGSTRMKWSVKVVCGTDVWTLGMWHDTHPCEGLTGHTTFGGSRVAAPSPVEPFAEAVRLLLDPALWQLRHLAS